MNSSRRALLKRLIFPCFNGFVFMILFILLGYYVSDVPRWALIGLGVGLAIGLGVEFGLGALGGWIYRRRITVTVLLEIVLIVALIGPFIYFYVQTPPNHYAVCCIEQSGLGAAVEAVRIPVADGESVAGWYAPPDDARGAVVMVLHGGGSSRLGSLAHARLLHAAGYGVLVYDQRANGESTGEIQSLGVYDKRDIAPIIDWLAARPEVDAARIGGVGLSLGAQILVMAGPDEARLKAIWADGLGVNSIEDLPHYEGIANAFIWFINRQTFWMAEWYLGEQRIPFRQLIPRIAPRPLMLVAGGLDPYEADFNRGYEPLLGTNGALWVIEDAWHLGGLAVEPELYPARMLAFFDEALRQ